MLEALAQRSDAHHDEDEHEADAHRHTHVLVSVAHRLARLAPLLRQHHHTAVVAQHLLDDVTAQRRVDVTLVRCHSFDACGCALRTTDVGECVGFAGVARDEEKRKHDDQQQ